MPSVFTSHLTNIKDDSPYAVQESGFNRRLNRSFLWMWWLLWVFLLWAPVSFSKNLRHDLISIPRLQLSIPQLLFGEQCER